MDQIGINHGLKKENRRQADNQPIARCSVEHRVEAGKVSTSLDSHKHRTASGIRQDLLAEEDEDYKPQQQKIHNLMHPHIYLDH